MDYHINFGVWGSVFAVPTAVVDEHIRLAGSAQLKVLLWLLRHAGEQIETGRLAGAIGLSRVDAADAMQYWIEVGLLLPTLDDSGTGENPDKKTEPTFAPITSGVSVQEALKKETDAPDAGKKTKKTHVTVPAPKPTDAEVVKRAGECQSIAHLLEEAQVRFGRPLSHGESSTLVWLCDYNGLPAEVLMMIIEFSLSGGKNNMRYIETVAISWANEEIDSIEKAEQKLAELYNARAYWNKVQYALSMTQRSPSPREEQYATRWLEKWKFSTEMIRKAYDECVDNTGKMSFAYMNTILERWQKTGVQTIADIAEAGRKAPDKQKGKPAKKQENASFNLEEYERVTSVMPALRKEK